MLFTHLSPSDYRVALDFRWRGLVYKAGSGLPADMPQGAMTQFLRKNPPLIKLLNGDASNGAGLEEDLEAANPAASNGSGKKKTSRKK